MKNFEEFLEESRGIKNFIKKFDWWADADTRTPEEIRDQIRNLDDETLKIWYKGVSKFGTGRKMFQDKVIIQELKRRGITVE